MNGRSKMLTEFRFGDNFYKELTTNTNGTFSYLFKISHKGQGFFYNSFNDSTEIEILLNNINVNKLFTSYPIIKTDSENLYIILEEIHFELEEMDVFKITFDFDVDQREGIIDMILGDEID